MVIAEDVIGFVLFGYALAWAAALAYITLLAIVLILSRGRSDAVRNVFRRAVATSGSRGSPHAAGQGGSPSTAMGAIRELRAADPGFDLTAFLDSARVAAGAYAAAYSVEDDRLLRRITTPDYWHTSNGKAIADAVAGWQRYAGNRPGTSNRGRILLDVSWRHPEVTNVALSDQDMDRITVRLASVITVAAPLGGHRIEATQSDWDFVRPTGQRTVPGSVLLPRTCADCGGLYHADLDETCPYCHTPRPDTRAGWRLDRGCLASPLVRSRWRP
jgi:hypothetical protein